MYKDDCVECLKIHHLKCMWNIPFKDRFLGNDNVKFCPEYIKITSKDEKGKNYEY